VVLTEEEAVVPEAGARKAGSDAGLARGRADGAGWNSRAAQSRSIGRAPGTPLAGHTAVPMQGAQEATQLLPGALSPFAVSHASLAAMAPACVPPQEPP